jgi:hypothetical protein
VAVAICRESAVRELLADVAPERMLELHACDARVHVSIHDIESRAR